MFHHVVLMKFSPNVERDFFEKVEAFCERIRSAEDRPLGYVFRPNLASRSDGLDYGIVASFESSSAHDIYQLSEVHQEMKSYMSPLIDRIVVCDIDETSK